MRLITSVFLTAHLLAASFAHADNGAQPDAPTVKRLALELLKAKGESPGVKLEVRSVLGCYPIKDRPAADRLCLVDIQGRDGTFLVQPLPFSKAGTEWKMLEPDEPYSPACPAGENARTILSKAFSDSALKLVDTPDSGNFTDDRGMNRELKGPMRLMCVYGVSGALGNRTVVGYFRFDGQSYLMDADREIWTD